MREAAPARVSAATAAPAASPTSRHAAAAPSRSPSLHGAWVHAPRAPLAVGAVAPHKALLSGDAARRQRLCIHGLALRHIHAGEPVVQEGAVAGVHALPAGAGCGSRGGQGPRREAAAPQGTPPGYAARQALLKRWLLAMRRHVQFWGELGGLVGGVGRAPHKWFAGHAPAECHPCARHAPRTPRCWPHLLQPHGPVNWHLADVEVARLALNCLWHHDLAG